MSDEDIAKELADIKKLFILNLMSAGVNSTDIAKTLGVTKGRLSQIVKRPSKKSTD
ncbi:MAG: hypothetical protein WC607_02235 [Candidatus Micrarchaeia archaeon]